MIIASMSVQLRQLSHGIARWYIKLNASERSKAGPNGAGQVLGWRAFFFHSSPQDVPDLLLNGPAVRCRCRLDAQFLLDPLIQISNCDACQCDSLP